MTETVELFTCRIGITIIGLICFALIRGLNRSKILSNKEFYTLTAIGPFSWGLQMWLLGYIDMSSNLRVMILGCALLAFACFGFVVNWAYGRIISGRDAAQTILWGEFVFPLVLVAFLPKGIHTLLNLL